MKITQYKGKTLLLEDTISSIQRQADLIVKNKDVAQAWQAETHLKQQISSLPQEEIKPVLDKYRAITSKLKALALPLLEQSDVEHLLENNLEFLDTEAEQYLAQGLQAWIASQPDEKQEEIKKKLNEILPKGGAISVSLRGVLYSGRRGNLIDAMDTDDKNNNTQRNDKIAAVRNTFPRNDTNLDSEESIARQIFSQSGSKQSEKLFVRLAQALVKSRLHNVRTKVDIAEYLSRPFEVGGLGLSPDIIDSVQNIIESAYNRVHSIKPNLADISQKQMPDNQKTTPNGMASGKPTGLPSGESDKLNNSIADTENLSSRHVENISKVVEVGGIEPPRRRLSNSPGKPATPTTKSIIPQNKAQKQINNLIESEEKDIQIEQIIKAKPKPEFQPHAKPAEKHVKSMLPIAQKPALNGKVRIDDIKTAPYPHARQTQNSMQAKGLSDEFNAVSLNDLRAMGNMSAAEKKITSKLNVLSGESIARKISAIKNFRLSPVYRQYLAIGNASLSQGKKLSEVLPDLSVNPDKMTQDEFFAISDLNGKLK